MIKALILDLDGTTVENRVDAMPSIAVTKAIQAAKNFVKVACATGRSVSTARPIISILGLTSPCIVSGGALIVDPISFETIWEAKLSKEKIQEVVESVEPYDFYVKVSGDKHPKVLARDCKVLEGNHAMFLIGLNREEINLAKQVLLLIKDINFHVTTSWEPNKMTIQITHRDASKKHALHRWLEIEKVEKENVLAIGDSYNDLPLFEVAGVKIAMASAEKEVQDRADWIAPVVEQDGVAVAIDRYILMNT